MDFAGFEGDAGILTILIFFLPILKMMLAFNDFEGNVGFS